MRRFLWASGAAVVVVASIAVFGVWTLLLRGDQPPPATLGAALEAAGVTPVPTSNNQPVATESPGDAGEPAGVEGVWTLDANGSFVGYRVREELVGIGATTAVGRTSTLEGMLEFDGEAVIAVQVTADLRDLRSDDSRRDGQLRRQALETNRFPEATFVLVEPIAIGNLPPEGVAVSATAVGDLTLRDVTQRVEVAVDGQLTGDAVVVVGALEIEFADYGISRPTAPLVLSVEDRAVMELQLVFRRS